MPAYQPQRLAALAVVALLLMWTDSRYGWAQPLRYGIGYVLAPAQQTALVPQLIGRWFGESATSRQQLLMENQQAAGPQSGAGTAFAATGGTGN